MKTTNKKPDKIIMDSLTYPLKIKSYIGLLILFSTSFLIVPGILGLGYLLRIIFCTINGENEHPVFNNWKNMFLDGLIFLGMVLIFGIMFYVLLWILEFFLIKDVGLNLGTQFISALYAVLFNALFVMCLAHMAKERSFRAAFEFRKIFGFIKEVGWIKYLALIVFMTLLGGLINLLIGYISPALVIPGLGPTPGVITITLLAYTYLFSFESRYAGLLYPNSHKRGINMRQKLNLITLGVNDLERSLEFYEKGLNWEKSESSTDNLALFQLGGIVLALYPRTLLAEDATVDDKPAGFSGITFSYNAKSELEVDEIIEEVRNLGAEIAKPPQKVFWGGYSGYFKDPDGHLFEVAFNPLWELDENDNLDL